MKALKVLAFILLTAFSYTAVSAQPIHHKRRHHKKHHVIIHHRHHN